MKRNVKPAANGIIWGILPGLEAIAMGEIMGWLPVVERLIAVLDGREQGRDQACSKEEVEGRNGLHDVDERKKKGRRLGLVGGNL